ncbi:MAG: nucleoside phosphorylase [Clostridia bacterium]|nr:nucleoside phosphorylase [Clostridia bacterium]
MSTLQFDPNPRAVINPDEHYAPVDGMPKTIVSCFPLNLIEYAAQKYGAVEIAQIKGANGVFPVYRLPGMDVGLVMALVGAPNVVSEFENLFAYGAERILVFGTCGVLNRELADCAIIIPDCAVRDEGTSRHYAPESDEIAANAGTLDLLTGFFSSKGLSHTVGKVWTTDGFFRETPALVAERKAQGCIAVEMECSALAALEQFRSKPIAQFIYAADNLDAEVWDERSLSNHANVDAKQLLMDLAIELASDWAS